jgi:hypothetical protein
MARTRRAPSTPSPTTQEPTPKKRPLRERPTPKWVVRRADLDPMAQRRCLMVLSVLSGEKPVTAVTAELGISRGTYYQLETKALVAMLRALAPGSDDPTTAAGASVAQRIAELEAKVKRLEQEKRRVERLLYLARKVVPAGPVVGPARRGRPLGSKNRGSATDGRRPSPPSATTTRTTTPVVPASTPTPAGATTP